jgi:APA family basic amino acid/polyamine antiporter
VVVIYVAVQLVSQGILGAALTGAEATPLATAFGRAYGPAGRTFMLAGAAISMFGFLCGAILTGPRSVFALGRDGFAPRALGAVHPVWHTPAVAIVVFALVALGLGLSGSVEQLAVITNLASLLVYMGVALAAWALQARGVRLEGEPFRLPAGPLIPLLACAVIATVIAATVTRVEVAAVTAAIVVSCVAYVARSRRTARM